MVFRSCIYQILLAVALCASTLSAGQETIHFKKVFDLKQQLDGGFLRDSDGFLWIGGTSGLYRYDGFELKEYKAGPESISSNWVRAIVEDHQANIWIGSYNGGLTRYDKKTDTFTHYKHDPDNGKSLSSNIIPYDVQAILVDRAGALWIATQGGGLNKYNRETDSFTRFRHDPDNKNSLSSDKVTVVFEDKEGILWVGTEDGGLNRFDREKKKWVHFQHDPDNTNTINDIYIRTIHEDGVGILWVGTQKGGLSRFDKKTGNWRHYTFDPDDPTSISANNVSYIYEDRSGGFWICHNRLATTETSGLDLFDKKTGVFKHYRHEPDNPDSLNSNMISRVYEDPETGIFWILNHVAGINIYDPKGAKFKLWPQNPKVPGSLSGKGVTEIFEDSRGNIWIGTLGGLDLLDKRTDTFTHFGADSKDPEKFAEKWIPAITEDRAGTFWVASKNILHIFDRKTGKVVKRYAHEPKNPQSLTRCTAIRSMTPDRLNPNIIWIATHGGGLDKFNIEREIFTHFKNDPKNPNSLSNDVLRVIYDDGEVLWVPTFNGLNRLVKKTGKLTRYFHDPKDPESISSSFLLGAHRDMADNLWIIGKGGLSRLDEKSGKFKNYTTADGFPEVLFTSLLEDDQGNLWMGTGSSGLVRFDPKTESVKVFTEADGLQGNQFWGDSQMKTKDGQLWFGGATGANSFYPNQVVDNPYVPPIVLTSLKQGGEKMALGKAAEKASSITLDWRNNFFEFQFAALNYTKPERNRYAYMLEGVDKEWYYSGANPFGRYSNLPGGTYTLRLKGSNNDGIWNEEGISVQVTVVPPIWQRGWFQTLAVLLLAGSVFITVFLRVQAIKKRKEELEIQVAERTRELEFAKNQAETEKKKAEVANEAKSVFLANMSHELRTPLNSISGYAQILMRRIGFSGPMLNGLNVIQQSSNHLLTLINDILDMAKIEAGRIELEETPFELVGFLQEIVGIIGARAEAKGLDLTFETISPMPSRIVGDERRLRQVLLNLMSNAVKFTDRGHVTLSVELLGESKVESGERQATLRFSVEDSGIGLKESVLDKIFEPFERVQDGENYVEGTGLGLPITAQILEMMNSRLHVESSPGKGSSFWFVLKLLTTDVVEEEPIVTMQTITGYQGERRTVLLVDDKPYNLMMLSDILTPLDFEVLQAENGQEGIEMALEHRPDLIIMDLVMPVKTGIEATMEIRNHPEFEKTVILASSASPFDQHKKKSLIAGCDGFLTKPINLEDLLDFIETHLELKWIHKDPDSRLGEAPQDIVAPPQEVVKEIQELALQGRILELKKIAAQLSDEGERFTPFGDKLINLINGFEIDRIIKWTKELMKE